MMIRFRPPLHLFSFLVLIRACAGDWPQFLGPTRNGVYAGTDLADSWPKEGPPVVWRKKVGQGFSGPVVSGGSLILFHRTGDKEAVECLEAGSGKQLWSFAYPTGYRDDFGFDEGPRATPTIAQGKVFTLGAEGMLHCLDFQTGKKIWSVNTKAEFAASKGFFGMVCSPLVEGNAVLLNIGGANGAGIVAFELSNGKLRWKSTNDEASYSSPVAATVNGLRYAFFFTRAGLAALDPDSGRSRFEFPWRSRTSASVNAATPLVVDDLVFVSASYQTGAALLRVKANSVEKIWSADDVLSNHYATCVHSDGFLFGFDGRQEYGENLRCVDFNTGKIRWSEDRFGAGTVTLAGKRLLILMENGELLLAPASPEGFKPASRAQLLPNGVRAYPALADGRFYARSKDTLLCADLRPPK
jgi:outer membrane protein assembly factor BamB